MIIDKTVKTIEDIDAKTYLNAGAKIRKQTIENIKKILDPILTYAEIVKIFDPYFMIDKDRFFGRMDLILGEKDLLLLLQATNS